jgi:hypothetical protein
MDARWVANFTSRVLQVTKTSGDYDGKNKEAEECYRGFHFSNLVVEV